MSFQIVRFFLYWLKIKNIFQNRHRRKTRFPFCRILLAEQFVLPSLHKSAYNLRPPALYNLNTDKQRVVLVGETRGLAGIITHVLKSHSRKFDYAKDTQLISTHPNSPVIIIENPAEENNPHIVVTVSPDADTKIFDHLPKGGIIIYNKENVPVAKAAEVVRVDIQPIGVTSAEVDKEMKNIVKTFTKEEKIAIGAARELLKKLGITPAQFEESLSTFTFEKKT